MKPKAFVAALDDVRIVAAIAEAEARSRGEIRVHVAQGHVPDVRRAAEAAFVRLGMAKTDEHNGVLILVAPQSQTFSIVGDSGINEKLPPGYWDEIAAAIASEFKAGHFTEGILGAVTRVGDELARHFPRQAGQQDENELPDSVSRD